MGEDFLFQLLFLSVFMCVAGGLAARALRDVLAGKIRAVLPVLMFGGVPLVLGAILNGGLMVLLLVLVGAAAMIVGLAWPRIKTLYEVEKLGSMAVGAGILIFGGWLGWSFYQDENAIGAIIIWLAFSFVGLKTLISHLLEMIRMEEED